MIYQMMNGRISKRTLTKMIKAYYMCAQNGVVYKGYTEWTGDKLSYVRKYILCKCADRRIDSKNIDEGCGTDELDIVWLNDGLLLIAEKDAVVQGRICLTGHFTDFQLIMKQIKNQQMLKIQFTIK